VHVSQVKKDQMGLSFAVLGSLSTGHRMRHNARFELGSRWNHSLICMQSATSEQCTVSAWSSTVIVHHQRVVQVQLRAVVTGELEGVVAWRSPRQRDPA